MTDEVATSSDDSVEAISEVLPLLRFYQIVRRWKVSILLLTFFGTILGGYFGAQLTPKYSAEAQLMIDPGEKRIVDLESVVSGLPVDSVAIETEIGLIRSRANIKQIMDDLSLFDDPEFVGTAEEQESTAGTSAWNLIDQAFALISNDWRSTTQSSQSGIEATDAANVARFDKALDRFNEKLSVFRQGESYIIGIEFTSIDSKKATLIANYIAKFTILKSQTQRVDQTNQASDWLGERVEALRAELQVSEAAIEEFRSSNNLNTTRDGGAPEVSELSRYNAELVQLRASESERRATLDLIKLNREQGGNLFEIAEISSSSTLSQLQQQARELSKRRVELSAVFGENHPNMLSLFGEEEEIKARIDSEVGRIIQAISNDVRIAEARRVGIEAEVERLRSVQNDQRALDVQLRELEREADATRLLYNTFLQRLKETREQEDIVEANVRMVSSAVQPRDPSTPDSKLFAILGFCISLMSGCGLAALADQFDTGLRTSSQVKQALGIATIGLVPSVKELRKNYTVDKYLVEKPMSAYAEAIRRSYLAIYNPRDEAKASGGQVVMVTSSLPNEGKTTYAVSLATFSAQRSKRTLIIDLDLRRPSVGEQLGVSEPELGIIECCITGDSISPSAAVHKSEVVDNMDALLASSKRHNIDPFDFIGDDKLADLLTELRSTYDMIIIDSPPILGVTETSLAATLADKAVFVIRWGTADKKTLSEAVDRLSETKVKIVGAIITQAEMHKQATYDDSGESQHYSKFEKYYTN